MSHCCCEHHVVELEEAVCADDRYEKGDKGDKDDKDEKEQKESKIIETQYDGQKVRWKVIDGRYRIGMHVKLQGTLFRTVSRLAPAHRVLQFYLHQVDIVKDTRGKRSRNLRLINISPADKWKTREWLDRWNHRFYIHSPVELNFARLDGEWFLGKSMDMVRQLTKTVYDLPAGTVLHIGNGRRGGSLETVARHVNDLHLPRNPHPRGDALLYLENAAGKGNDLGVSWDDIRHLFEAIDRPVVGLCIDTQHLFAAGESDFADHEAIARLFDSFEASGPKIRPIFHLNDSKTSHCSRKDRHESIGQGKIWSAPLVIPKGERYVGATNNQAGREGLNYLLERGSELGTDFILETPTAEEDLRWLNYHFLP